MNIEGPVREFDAALEKLDRWIEKSDWKAYDTFDGLSSPFSGLLTLQQPFLRQVWQQGVRRFPINLRPILGIKPATSSKGMGFMAQGYLRLYQVFGKDEYLRKMAFCLDWLLRNPSPKFKGLCWGNHFDYQSRSGRIPRGTPTVVWTGLIGQAFLDAYEALGDKRYLEASSRIADFIVNELGWYDAGQDLCLSYIPPTEGREAPTEENSCHNASMLGAAFLARLQKLTPNERYLDIARRAVSFTTRHQLADGAWYYAVGPKYHWVDSFHTGYVLEALYCYCRFTGDPTFRPHLEKGYRYFVDTFFLNDGTPRYYRQKTRPLDIQCASQGIQTLVNLRHLDPRSLDLAIKVATWTIRQMQDSTGYFYYRKYPLITNRTPTFHWGQATMLAALATLIAALRNDPIKTTQRPGPATNS
jgi:rhamnogalacturonyl hydrolase YesR